MKKIIVAFLFTFLLTSCLSSKTEEKVDIIDVPGVVNNIDAAENGDAIKKVDNDNSDMSDIEDILNEEKPVKDIINTKVEEKSPTSEAEEEVVKEFEKELDSLFELLEGDNE